mgnify:CR=1 FL=1
MKSFLKFFAASLNLIAVTYSFGCSWNAAHASSSSSGFSGEGSDRPLRPWEVGAVAVPSSTENENEEEAAAAFATMMQQASEVFHLLAHIDESAGTFSFTRQDLVSDRGHDFHLVPLTP